jgi:hypothetical protein
LDYLFDQMSPKVRGGYRRYKTQYVKGIPIPAVEFTNRRHLTTNGEDAINSLPQKVSEGDISPEKALEALQETNAVNVAMHDTLCIISDRISSNNKERAAYNLDLMDYLGSYESGGTLTDISGYQPASGVSSSALSKTSEEYDGLRIGSVRVQREGQKVIVEATARYKPENEDDFETDQWGYTETEYIPAIEFVGLDDIEKDLVQEFVPHATDEGDGFADFRDNATTTNSLLDRLNDLTLPDIEDVESGLRTYIDQKQQVSDIDEKNRLLMKFLNEVIYELYDLDEDESAMVENTIVDED